MCMQGDEEINKLGYFSLGLGNKTKGGFNACKFIFGKQTLLWRIVYIKPSYMSLHFFLLPLLVWDTVLTALDNMGFVANMVSLVVYFMMVMYFDLSNSATTLTNFMGATFLLTLVGGFISDTYLSRFTTCIIFGIIEILVYNFTYVCVCVCLY